MPIAVKCSCCGQAYRVPDTAAGKSIKCKKCTLPIPIPGDASSAAIAPQPLAAPQPVVAPVEAPIRMVEEAPAAPAPQFKTRTKKKKSKALFYVLMGLAAAFFFCLLLPAGAAVAWWFFASGGGGGDGMKYMPNNTNLIASIRVADAMKSDAYQQLMKEMPDAAAKQKEFNETMQKEANMTIEDVDQVLVGGDLNNKEYIVVVTTKKKMTTDDIMQTSANKDKKFKKTQVGKYTIYEEEKAAPAPFPGAAGSSTDAFCLVDSKMMVGGPINTLKAVLERDRKPELSDGMKAALKYADFSKPFSMAVHGKGMTSNLPMQGGMGAQMANIEGGALNITLKTDITIDGTLICKDDKSAEEIRKVADGGIAAVKMQGAAMLGSDTVQVLDSLKLANKANTVTATMEVKTAQLIKAGKSLPMGMGGGPPPGGPPMPPRIPGRK